jgi:hypothetical protein
MESGVSLFRNLSPHRGTVAPATRWPDIQEILMHFTKSLVAATSMLALSACAGMAPTERNAAIGAGLGGVAGYALGNQSAGGAAIGALAGGAAGWYLGCREEGRCGATDNRRAFRDDRTGRYYFRDEQSGRYFYENGEPYSG